MARKMSACQIQSMMAACVVYPRWFRARGRGERVTLASLYRGGLMERRVWRHGKNSADDAHEYRPTPKFVEIARADGVMA